MGFGDRLIKAREKNGLNQKELAQLLGITPTRLNYWEKNKREPDVFMIKKLASELKVSADYLIGNTVTKNRVTEPFTSEEKIHIKKYRTLDEHGKKLVDNVLNLECERVESTRTPVIPIGNVITLSEFEQPVSAGKGVYLGDGSQTITREVPNTEETRKADFILRVSGDSMEPDYSDGDRLLVKRQHDVEVGETGIFILNNEGFVKRREKDRLVSLNSAYEDIFFHDDDNIVCKGKVIGKL